MRDESFAIDVRGGKIAGSVRGDGPPVLWIQGTGVPGDTWKPQTDAFSAAYTCAWFDNRGYGRSVPRGDALTVDAMAKDALAVLDHLGWESAHVVGHSLGGLIALFLASQAPRRVKSLALLCTFATGAVPTRMEPGLLWTGMRTRIGTRDMRRYAFLDLVLSPQERARPDVDAVLAQLETAFGRSLGDPPGVVMEQVMAMRSATADLKPIVGIPTLVVSAEHDVLAPPSAGRAIAEGIAGARFVELPGTGHAVPVVAPERIEPLLREHLAR